MAYKISHIVKFILFSLISLSGILALSQNIAFADNSNQTYTLLEPLPCIPGGQVTCTTPGATQTTLNMGTFFQYAFNLLIALAAVAAVFMIVWGGFLYVTTSSSQSKSDGLKYFKNAIYGLLMIFGAYLILHTVNPTLTAFPTSIPAIQAAQQATAPSNTYDQLTQQLSSYQLVDSSPIKSEIIDTQVEINDLVQQKSDLQNQINTAQYMNANPVDQDLLAADMADLDSQISNLQAKTSIDTAMVSFQNSLATAAQHPAQNTAQSLDNLIKSVQSNYAIAQDQAVNSPDAQKLKDAENYTIGLLTIQKDGLSNGATTAGDIVSGAWGAIKGAVTSANSTISSAIPGAGSVLGLGGAVTGFTSTYSNAKQQRIATSINNDVINSIAPNIQDPALKSQLIQYANQVVQGTK